MDMFVCGSGDGVTEELPEMPGTFVSAACFTGSCAEAAEMNTTKKAEKRMYLYIILGLPDILF
jgi:hypothetical protein